MRQCGQPWVFGERRAGAKAGTRRLARAGKRPCAGCACGCPAFSGQLANHDAPTEAFTWRPSLLSALVIRLSWKFLTTWNKNTCSTCGTSTYWKASTLRPQGPARHTGQAGYTGRWQAAVEALGLTASGNAQAAVRDYLFDLSNSARKSTGRRPVVFIPSGVPGLAVRPQPSWRGRPGAAGRHVRSLTGLPGWRSAPGQEARP